MVTSGSLKSPDCPRSVLDLIERFELHRETYKGQTYNETQVRREFIDPLFKALGWNSLPIPTSIVGHEGLSGKVNEILRLHERLRAAKTPTDKTGMFGDSCPLPHGRGSDWIDATDRRIDQLVYELYGLSEEEIKIVEEATRR